MTRIPSWSMQFAFALSAVFTIGALSAGGISYFLQTRELSSRLASDVRSIAESLAQISEGGDRQDLEEQIRAQTLASRDGSTLVAWVDETTGDAIGNFRPQQLFEGARRLDPVRDMRGLQSGIGETADAYEAFAIRTPMGTVIAARDTAWISESGEILMQSTFWGLGATLLMSFALAIGIARRNERRIQKMETLLEAVGRGRLDLRIRDPERDDLARVANNVDATLDRLEAGVESIKQVSTDVAHDLRAPLARLRMKIEPYATDPTLPAQLRYVFGGTLNDIDDISGTFDSILRLAGLQSGAVAIEPKEIDLTALVRDVGEIMSPIAEDAGHDIGVVLPATATPVRADRELLTQVLINLADNAIRHCPAPTNITIGVNRDQGAICLWVADHGPGIPQAERERVLERFVRLDRSRRTAGTGLGLSLVKAIATLHGAKLSLDDNAPGLQVALTFVAKG